MYKLSVFAIFKNESHCLKEWLEHYLYHGVDHFYLINDNSDDNFLEILEPYIEKNIITLFNTKSTYYLGRQRNLYNEFVLPRIKESSWLLLVDLDEFVWSPISINLNDILKNVQPHIGQIQIEQSLFGSNNHITQPKTIVSSFTKRAETKGGNLKYFINSDYEFTSLNVHHATFLDKNHEKNNFIFLDSNYLVLNHYCCQSFEFWKHVKCTRGDADNYRIRTEEDFISYDKNEIEDLSLVEQNRNIIF